MRRQESGLRPSWMSWHMAAVGKREKHMFGNSFLLSFFWRAARVLPVSQLRGHDEWQREAQEISARGKAGLCCLLPAVAARRLGGLNTTRFTLLLLELPRIPHLSGLGS